MGCDNPESKILQGDFQHAASPENRTAPARYQPVRKVPQNRQEAAECLTEDLGMIFCALDAEGRIAYHNRAWKEFYERNGSGDVSGMPTVGDVLLDPLQVPAIDDWQQAMTDLHAGRISFWEDVLPCHAPNQHRWMLERVQRVGDEFLLSIYFLRAYGEEAPEKTHLRCLFTSREKDAQWEAAGVSDRRQRSLGFCPECSLQIYAWLRGEAEDEVRNP